MQRFKKSACQVKKTMKNKMMLLLLILTATTLSCKKEVKSDCLQAKVIRITCASTVIQVLNNHSIGEDGWMDTFNNNSPYDNVFTAANPCHIPSEYKVGDVLYITIGKPVASDCIQCAMYDAPPKISFEVKTLGNLPCNEELPK